MEKTFDDYLKASPSERRKMNMSEILGEERLAKTKEQMSLEEAAQQYAEGPECTWAGTTALEEAFKAGAKWQKEQDTRDMYMSNNRHFQKVYELGKKDMKQQMLKDAVEGRIGAVGLHNSIFIKEPEWTESLDRLNEGDKVKIICVKED